jgi:hypothetical protein
MDPSKWNIVQDHLFGKWFAFPPSDWPEVAGHISFDRWREAYSYALRRVELAEQS